MQQFARTVIGYHGCSRDYAAGLLTGELSVSQWEPSQNAYDWLGHGIYFWEHGPARAIEWANANVRDGEPDVIGAVIQIGSCLDFTDITYTRLLGRFFTTMAQKFKELGIPMPRNALDGKRELDCTVINTLHAILPVAPFDTVRGVFTEGAPAFPGSGIAEKSHIQLAVRNTDCIIGVFRPS